MNKVIDSILSLKSHYRSGKSDLGKDFFGPCLKYCKSYKRAVGYFSSSALITWASVLPRFVNNEKVYIELLISPILNQQDKDALKEISDPKKKSIFLQSISDKIIFDALEYAKGNNTDERRMRLFSWLVATNKLKLRFAFPKHVDGPGIFHEKIGIFYFQSGEKVAFTGSANETKMGHSKNYESIDVFRSWIPSDKVRVKIKEEEFHEAWKGVAKGLIVKKLSSKALDEIKAYSIKYDNKNKDENMGFNNKWRHQNEAIDIFLKEECGVLNMATGTGKTRTALRICKELFSKGDINTIIISTDGKDLLYQWCLEILRWNKEHLKYKFDIKKHFGSFHEKDLFVIDAKWKILIVSRHELSQPLSVVNNSEAGRKTLLVHDEVHGLGSPANIRDLKGLTDNIRFKLGLSATPEREYDEEGNHFILDQIGPTIYEFGLEDAIKRGILCPFNYHPIEYEITEEDKMQLKILIAHYNALKETSDPMPEKVLWRNMANVYKTSEAKIPLFDRFIAENTSILKRCIIFVQTTEYGEQILEVVHKYHSNFHTYFSGEDSDTLKRFANGELECLITCHRLSEGIDIKSLNNIILFATDKAKLELIQRIGRSLRTNPDDPEKIANIVDFIRVNNNNEKKNSDEIRKEWLTSLSKIRPKE